MGVVKMKTGGLAYVIRGDRANVKGYIYKPMNTKKFVYIPAHKVSRYKTVLESAVVRNLPESVCFGINQRVLNSRADMANKLSDLIWSCLTSWVNPGEIYNVTGLTHQQIEGLTNGPEAFIYPITKYEELMKRLISYMESNGGRLNIKEIENTVHMPVIL